MSVIDHILNLVPKSADQVAFIHDDLSCSTEQFYELIDEITNELNNVDVKPFDRVVLVGDFSAMSLAALVALIKIKATIIPLTNDSFERLSKNVEDLQPHFIVRETVNGLGIETRRAVGKAQSVFSMLEKRQASGLVLFTSGTSGKPKAVIHDFDGLLKKFLNQRRAMVTINFLLFDHWGGLNTFFHCFASNCVLVFPRLRNPDYICELIEKHKIELLPTTPSFLNLLIISGAIQRYDISSLKLITYGAEPMPMTTLEMVRKQLPGIELRQTYGMIEIGVLKAKSKNSDSLWVKIGGEGCDIRVVDGILQVKSTTTMLGYIGEEMPLTKDGYFITGDAVEQNGDWLRILGRKSEIVMVGAEKVYPIEVESVLLKHPHVVDVMVFGERNPILGNVLCAHVQPHSSIEAGEKLLEDLRAYASDKLKPYMRPIKYVLNNEIGVGSRAKKVRTAQRD